jgi:hypothetical protein
VVHCNMVEEGWPYEHLWVHSRTKKSVAYCGVMSFNGVQCTFLSYLKCVIFYRVHCW